MWVERLARFGYAAKGVVYAVVGILAVMAAFGQGGRTTDTQGALAAIAQQPFGQILLILIAIGLVGYVLWRAIQAVMDPENEGSDAKGWAHRLGYAISAVIYAGLCFTAIRLIIDSSQQASSGNSSAQDWTARLMAQPFGRWLVGIVGAIVIGYGLYQFYKAYKAKFRKKMKTHEMSHTEETWATRFGRFGLAARGVVFVLIGIFLAQAARQANPQQAIGLDGALQTLSRQSYGPWLLAIVALGLIAYGIHMLAQARYRRILAPDVRRELMRAGRR